MSEADRQAFMDMLYDLSERVSNLEQSIVGLTALLLHDEQDHTDQAKQYFDTFRKGARQ